MVEIWPVNRAANLIAGERFGIRTFVELFFLFETLDHFAACWLIFEMSSGDNLQGLFLYVGSFLQHNHSSYCVLGGAFDQPYRFLWLSLQHYESRIRAQILDTFISYRTQTGNPSRTDRQARAPNPSTASFDPTIIAHAHFLLCFEFNTELKSFGRNREKLSYPYSISRLTNFSEVDLGGCTSSLSTGCDTRIYPFNSQLK